MKKNFIIIGVGGYVAPRHLKAIKELGHNLVAAMDVSDSVGILDSYFPECSFFTSLESLEAFLIDFNLSQQVIDYTVVCTPNFLHKTHIRFGLKYSNKVICEKPLVLSSADIPPLESLIREGTKEVFTILQLRLHPEILNIKRQLETKSPKQANIELTYITGRGQWYHKSWKGDISKSGGIVCNIGIHLFDMLIWIFGSVLRSETHHLSDEIASGVLYLERAKVKWFLSINKNLIPPGIETSTHRELKIDDYTFDFTSGFENLHTESYDSIVNQDAGFRIDQVKESIDLTDSLRNSKIEKNITDGHSMLGKLNI